MISYPGLKLGAYNPPSAFHISTVNNDSQGDHHPDNPSKEHHQPEPNPKLAIVCDDTPKRIGTIIDIYV